MTRTFFRQLMFAIAAILIAILIGAAIGRAHAAMTRQNAAVTLRAVIILHRAAELCPQYRFTTAKGLDYAGVVRGARAVLGEQAVDEELDRENS